MSNAVITYYSEAGVELFCDWDDLGVPCVGHTVTFDAGMLSEDDTTDIGGTWAVVGVGWHIGTHQVGETWEASAAINVTLRRP